jgi:nicotinamide mononucleotide transporter
MYNWVSENYIEIFGAITGIIYVFLEIRQTIWLWPLGLVTSAIYVWIFFGGKLYADMSLQAYYVVISILGWYWWLKGAEQRAQGENSPFEGGQPARLNDFSRSGGGDVLSEGAGRNGEGENDVLKVTRLRLKTGLILFMVFIILYLVMWLVLSRLTDSPVPGWDAFLTSLSIVATWMLARKIYEHWFLWIVVNIVSFILYFTRGLYPTVALYIVYAVMSFIGLKAWKKTIGNNSIAQS